MTHKPRLLVHTSRQPIRWGDMDALGHVNNTVYFRYMEQARIEWLYGARPRRAARCERHRAGDRQRELHVPACRSSIPGDVEVRMFLGDPGRTQRRQLLRDLHRTARSYADGAAKIVWIDLATGRPRAAAGRGRGAAARARRRAADAATTMRRRRTTRP